MTTPAAAAEIFGDNLEKAIAYHESLATDGSVRGFIGPREVPRLWDRHILNCAVIGEAMDEGISVADIGSGAGLPGIPLAIARPDLNITLIEPLLKRSVYLNEVKEALSLENVTVIRGRAEEKTVRKQVGAVDVVTSRAVAPLGKLAAWSLPLVKIGGRMVAMKGSSVEEEIERDAADIRKAGGTDIKVFTVGESLLSEPTTLISIRREK
ncbi:Ribosomal RNA small subunit methyltransferase G [Corynebacterium deserti GIMN1.010]|uniref:Ribosomal RNA small subunit methyltransferase G n=1 Tax=Corynebacterium deserti GIMN1.010 TaxID=931089 RepID=A0A0M4CIG2_9CORY|nr:16S rRNA (guanine(527)-N(7))-methyltransferase RsmG [Corynebacterium deserti]ALC07152.1 Ribosomal RNA small subunit methyltransferase G [Corynebacterium deserti GIMN1.010]